MAEPKPNPMELVVVHEEFLEEAERFNLCFRCDDCAHFDRGGDSCSFGHPTAAMRDGSTWVLGPRGGWMFCKEFELL